MKDTTEKSRGHRKPVVWSGSLLTSANNLYYGLTGNFFSLPVADLGEAPPYFRRKQKKRLKEERPAGQVN